MLLIFVNVIEAKEFKFSRNSMEMDSQEWVLSTVVEDLLRLGGIET